MHISSKALWVVDGIIVENEIELRNLENGVWIEDSAVIDIVQLPTKFNEEILSRLIEKFKVLPLVNIGIGVGVGVRVGTGI